MAKKMYHKVCECCGAEFETENPYRRTCSKDCQYYLMTKIRMEQDAPVIKKVCKGCGKEFETTAPRQWYCSESCRTKKKKSKDKLKREQVLETHVPLICFDGTFSGTRAICPVCRKEFVYTDRWVYKHKGLYCCSYTCMRKAEKSKKKKKESSDGKWDGWV